MPIIATTMKQEPALESPDLFMGRMSKGLAKITGRKDMKI